MALKCDQSRLVILERSGLMNIGKLLGVDIKNVYIGSNGLLYELKN